MKSDTQFKQTEIGEIPEDWDIVPAAEYCVKVTDGTHDSPKQQVSGKYLVTSRHITGGDIDLSKAYKISEIDFNSINKRSGVNQWDILFSMIGTVGEAVLVKNIDVNFAIKNIGLFKNKNETDAKWLYYFLKSPPAINYIKGHSSGSTQQYLTLESLRKFPIVIATPKDTSNIIGILSSLDDKIELNRRMNKTLEEIGKALFKQWFVDFEFPNENGEPYKSSGGEMVESELGEIPRGWKVEPVGNYLTILDSKRIPLSSRERSKRQGEYRYYGATGVVDYVDDFLFDGVYLLLGEDGTVTVDDGYPYTQYVWGQFWVNNHAHVLLGEKQFSTEYLKLFFDSTIISSYVTGAVQPKLNQTNLRSIPLIVPEKDLTLAFDKIILPLFAHIRKNEDEIQSLINARDSLLPRLMSGKIRV